MRRLLAAALLIAFPVTIFASGGISRRDGFLMLWQGIRRPAFESREKEFADVPEGAPGSLEITYAKSRGIIEDDQSSFQPDASLSLVDALLWLFRTRNVADPDEIAIETLPQFITQYDLDLGGLLTADGSHVQDRTLNADELASLARVLDTVLAEEDHEVSLYGEEFEGEGTAFGETFHANAFTAAHRTFPHNTLVRVTNVGNGKSVVVRINDRGPYVKGRDMDLSLAAFTSIEARSKGKFRAVFQRMGDASLVGVCGGEPAYQRRITRDVILAPGVPHFFSLGKTLSIRANKPFVIRGITYPDGSFFRQQQFITKDETYELTPSIEGIYTLLLGDTKGRQRTMEMTVVQCDTSPDPVRSSNL